MSQTFRHTFFVFILLLVLGLVPLTASAHEEVTAGSYVLEVGWIKEPVLVGQPNGLDLFISQANPAATGDSDQAGDQADPAEHSHAEGTGEAVPAAGVTGAADSLKFTVEYGGVEHTYALQPVLAEPGHYTADLIPTRAGQYTFHFFGNINGEAVDLKVEPEEVMEASSLAFPEPVPSAADLAGQLAAAQRQARTAQMIAIVGLVLGLVGAGLGVYGLRRR
jgi:hypothetical protein